MNINEINEAIDKFSKKAIKLSIREIQKRASALKEMIQKNPEAKQINGVHVSYTHSDAADEL